MDLKRSETRNVLNFGCILGILECLIPPSVVSDDVMQAPHFKRWVY